MEIAHPAIAAAGPARLAGVGVGVALGISHRTVRRDIDRLREMGYRIEAAMGPDDDDQALAVAIALRAAPALGAGIGEALGRYIRNPRRRG